MTATPRNLTHHPNSEGRLFMLERGFRAQSVCFTIVSSDRQSPVSKLRNPLSADTREKVIHDAIPSSIVGQVRYNTVALLAVGPESSGTSSLAWWREIWLNSG